MNNQFITTNITLLHILILINKEEKKNRH